MSYRNLSIRKPRDSYRYNNQKIPSQVPSYCPSPRAYDTITRTELQELQKKNKELVQKLRDTEQAPMLVKNLVSELSQADARVKELQNMLKNSKGDDNKEAKADQLRDSGKRIRKLRTRLDEANRKNRAMELKLVSKDKLVRKFNAAVKDMDEVLKKLAYAKYRSKMLEDTLKRARDKERELRSAKMKVQNMQNELEDANRKLERLGNTLVTAHDRWNKRDRDVTHVKVDGTSVGKIKGQKTDIHGRPTRDAVKVIEIKDQGHPNAFAHDKDYLNRSNKEVELIRNVSNLEQNNALIDKQNKDLSNENNKLAAEVRILMNAMQKMGISLTPDQMMGQNQPVRRKQVAY